jgi:hypothetical protein
MNAKLPIFIVTACLFLIVLLSLNSYLENILEELKSLNAYLQIDLKMD